MAEELAALPAVATDRHGQDKWRNLYDDADFLGGCGGDGCGVGGLREDAGESGKMKVGLMVIGSTSDGGWNQLAKESLEKVGAAEDVEVRVQQQVGKDKAADALRRFECARVCARCIVHGFEYQDVVGELTKAGGLKVKIAVSGGDADSPDFRHWIMI